MADLNDCTSALVGLIATTLYPNAIGGFITGQSGLGALNSIAGYPVRIYGGWPKASALDLDMAGNVLVAGVPTANGVGPVVNVSVYPRPSVERNTTRYQRDWVDQTRVAATVTATVAGNVVTLGGTITAGNYVTLLLGSQEAPYSYALVVSDTLTTAAANLAALIPGATSSGPAITLPATLSGLVIARTGAAGTSLLEVRRQQRSFQITVWAPNNAARAAVANVIDPVLAVTDFLTLADQTAAWLLYQGQNDFDTNEVETVYRRDLFYWLEYATTQVMTSYPTTAFQTQIEADAASTELAPLPWPSFNPQINVNG